MRALRLCDTTVSVARIRAGCAAMRRGILGDPRAHREVFAHAVAERVALPQPPLEQVPGHFLDDRRVERARLERPIAIPHICRRW